jgi:predicted RNA-binding protein with RPS1 domain
VAKAAALACAPPLTLPFPQVELANRGGVVVRLNKDLTGFVPLSQIDPARVPAHAADAPMEAVLAALVGQPMRAAILELNADKGTVVLSEKSAAAAAEMASLSVGAVRTGTVKKLTEYGAFVELLGADGRPHGVEGLLHISELSWSRVRHPQDVLAQGQRLSVKIVALDPATGRIGLSLRQLAADPLLETLDTILPVSLRDELDAGGAGGENGAANELPLPGLLEICEALRGMGGVEAVTLGRQAREQRVVSQDLELWLTNDKVADGYNLVARAGRQVQEVHVKTALLRDDIKAAVQRCTSRMP